MSDSGSRRKSKRFKIKNMSKIDNCDCAVINVSRDGLLLETKAKKSQSKVDLQLKINGKWIDLQGNRMWEIENNENHHTRIGVFITKAPPEYADFVNNLYFEDDQDC